VIVLIWTLSIGTVSVGVSLSARHRRNKSVSLHVLFTVLDNGKSPAPCNPKQMNIQRLLSITSFLHAGLVRRNAVFQTFVHFDVGNFSLCSWDPVDGQSASPSVLLLLSQFLSFMKWGWLILWGHCFSHLMHSMLWTRPSWLLKASININRWEGMDWSHRLRTGSNNGCYKLGNESADSMKSIKFLDNLNDC